MLKLFSQIMLGVIVLVIIGSVVSIVHPADPPAEQIASNSTKPAPAAIKAETPPTLPQFYTIPSLIGSEIKGDSVATDAKALYELLDKANVRKTDFETTAEHKAKMLSIYASLPIGTHKISDFFLFSEPNKSTLISSLRKIGYDAESKGLLIEFREPTIYSEEEHLNDYYGSNAFGVTKEVKVSHERKYKLKFLNYNPFEKKLKKRLKEKNYSLLIPMDANEAKESLDNLAIVYAIQLEYPFTKFDYEHSSPTLDSPEDILHLSHSLVSSLQALYIVNLKTGKVIFEQAAK